MQQLMEFKAARPSATTTKAARLRACVPSLTILVLLITDTCAAARPKCLLHVGPHKTGTTTLQSALQAHANLLQQDGWHQPQRQQFSATYPGAKHFANVGLFLQGDNPNSKAPVWQHFLSWIRARVRANESIVLSSETLGKASVNRSLLASVLAPFKTTVVVGYRIFFDWILSVIRESTYQAGRDMDAINKSMLESLPLSRSLHAMVICKVYGRCALEKVYYGESTVYRSCDYFTDCRARSIYFTDDVMRAYAQHFDDTRLLPIGSHMVKTFVCSFMSAPLTCASLHKRPAKMMNVRALPPPPPPTSGLDAGLCASPGGCVHPDVRNMLLARAYSSAMELAPFLTLQLNETELGIRLDALGLCFCAPRRKPDPAPRLRAPTPGRSHGPSPWRHAVPKPPS